MKGYKELVILIAEDDDGHAELIQSGLKAAGVCNPMVRFSNGEQTWQYLCESKALPNNSQEQSFLLLLDINMPLMDGIEVLQRIKKDDALKDIPVLMLTTTDDPREVEQCYRCGCNLYITKPVEFPKFAETLKRLGLFIQIIKI